MVWSSTTLRTAFRTSDSEAVRSIVKLSIGGFLSGRAAEVVGASTINQKKRGRTGHREKSEKRDGARRRRISLQPACQLKSWIALRFISWGMGANPRAHHPSAGIAHVLPLLS